METLSLIDHSSLGSQNSAPRYSLWSIGFLVLLLSAYYACLYYEVDNFYIIILIGVCVLAWSLVDLESAFLVVPLTLTNPYTLSQTGTRLHISEYVLLIVFSVWFLTILLRYNRITFPPEFFWPSIIIVVAACLSVLVAKEKVAAFQQLVRYVEVLLAFFPLILCTVKDEKAIKRVLLMLIIGGMSASWVGIIQFLTSQDVGGVSRRIFGWHGGGYGAVMASTILLSVSALIYERQKIVRIIAGLTIPFAGVALILSQTRAWIAALVISAIIVLAVERRKVLGRLLIGIISVMVLVATIIGTNLFGLANKQIVTAAVGRAFQFGADPVYHSVIDVSLILRLNVWLHAIRMFLEHPLLGIGVGNLRFVDYVTGKLGKGGEGVGYVDNQYIQFFTEAGVLAGLCWIVYIFYISKTGVCALRSCRGTNLQGAAYGFFSSMLVFIIGSFFWVVTPHHEVFALFVLYAALLYRLSRLINATT